MTPTTATAEVHTNANTTDPAYFTASSRVRDTGTTSRLRSVPMFASPATASPDATDTASTRKNGSSTVNDVNTRNRPLSVIWLRNGGPSPSLGADSRTAVPISTGK